MFIDFPDLTRLNPWQSKTFDTCAPMGVQRTNTFKNQKCFAFHISWEDSLLRGFKSEDEALNALPKFYEFFNKQSKLSKIVWTLHNETSHYLQFKEAELKLRDIIMSFADRIILMSEKHAFKIPERFLSKIILLPHYIEQTSLPQIPRCTSPAFFRYGEARGERNSGLYKKILNNSEIKKYVSDRRLNIEVDSSDQVLTKRRFTLLECELYSRLANFSIFFRKPQFNSGVLNFLLGQNLVVLHDAASVKYMDLPESYRAFITEEDDFSPKMIPDFQHHLDRHKEETLFFLNQRSPRFISGKFWSLLRD